MIHWDGHVYNKHKLQNGAVLYIKTYNPVLGELILGIKVKIPRPYIYYRFFITIFAVIFWHMQ